MSIRDTIYNEISQLNFEKYQVEQTVSLYDYFINNSIVDEKQYKLLSAKTLNNLGFKEVFIFDVNSDIPEFDNRVLNDKQINEFVNTRKIAIDNFIITYDCESIEYCFKKKSVYLCSKDEFFNYLIKFFNHQVVDFIENRKNSLKSKISKKFSFFLQFLFIAIFVFDYTKCNSILLRITFFTIFIVLNSYKFIAIFLSLKKKKNQSMSNDNVNKFLSFDILCPVYQDFELVENIFYNIDNIKYPKEKLNIIFLVEEGDNFTVDKIMSMKLRYQNFNIVVIPDSFPKTKPKALNYGLLLSSNEIVCVFDIEDRPDLNQIHLVNNHFLHNQDTDIIQCKLKYYNRNFNLLTMLFDAEYRFWFNYQLLGFSRMSKICPLGGTSNYIKRSALQSVEGWDAYNVTEDLGLAVEFGMLNKKVVIIDSYTLEESPYKIFNFITQRIRWIKGYMLTYAKYFKYYIYPQDNRNIIDILNFHAVVGMNALCFFIYILYFSFSSLKSVYFFIFALFIQILQNVIMIFFERISMKNKILIIIFLPLYFHLHYIASIVAFLKISLSPYKWEKTKHGAYLDS